MTWWNTLPLEHLSAEQWEALCDGCGKCCLHKLQDEDDDTVYTTQVACALLNCATARCSDYVQRFARVSECTRITLDTVPSYTWLPATCAYRLRADNRPLPDWHPLNTGDADSTRLAGHSIAGRCLSARDVAEDDWQDYLFDDNAL